MKKNPTLDGEAAVIAAPNTMFSDLIKTLIDNYRSNQLKAINSINGTTDAHSIWFDLVTLKKFISDIETEAQKNSSNISEDDLGIRFYYAAYPKVENWDIMQGTPIGKEYAGKHTLVMVPTLKMPDEEGIQLNYDFNPLDHTTYNRKIGKQTVAMALSSKDSAASITSGEVIAQNHGALVPPESTKVEQF